MITSVNVGVKVGLCLPRKIDATSVARRPKFCLQRQSTYHLRSTSLAFAMNVVRMVTLLKNFLIFYIYFQSQ